MGKPVIASAHGGALETVIDGQTGWLVPPANVPELTAAIERAQDGLPQSAESLRTRILREFSKTRLQNSTLEVYARAKGL